MAFSFILYLIFRTLVLLHYCNFIIIHYSFSVNRAIINATANALDTNTIPNSALFSDPHKKILAILAIILIIKVTNANIAFLALCFTILFINTINDINNGPTIIIYFITSNNNSNMPVNLGAYI